MEYYLMRKDDVITLCEMSEDGMMISYSKRFRNRELAPLEYSIYPDHIRRWWQNRKVPVSQGRISKILKARGLADTGEFLLRNLGLSMTDCYWVRPVDSGLRWNDVQLFDNDFSENLLTGAWTDMNEAVSCSPNSSLKGELEKSWVIRKGKRVLIKGNHGNHSYESINEVVASQFHKSQRYDNYTDYKLIRVKGKEYDYGCCCEAFTSNEVEFVSANAILTSKKKPNGMPVLEFLIQTAEEHGIDAEQFRRDLDYQIMSDYMLSNVDRHMDNLGVLRNADSMKFIRMAPIFDTGQAFGGGRVVPYSEQEIDDIQINSFEETERKQLQLVTDRGVCSLEKALPVEKIEELYSKDSTTGSAHIKHVCRLYKKKLERIEKGSCFDLK